MIQNFKEIVTKDFLLLNICFILGFSPIFLFLLFPLHLKEIGALEHQIGALMGIFSVGALLSKPIAGRWIDSRGMKEVAFAGYAVSIISLIPMCFYHSITLYYFLRFFSGIGMSLCMTGLYTILLDTSPQGMIGQAIGLFGIANFFVSAMATIIGEYLHVTFGFTSIFILSIFNLTLSMYIFFFIRSDKRKRTSEHLPFFKTMVGDIRYYAAATFVFGAVHGALNSFISVYLKENGFKQVSLFFVFYALGAILLRIFFGYLVDKFDKAAIITVNFIVYSLVIAVISLYPYFYPLIIAAFIGGASHGFLFPAINAGVVTLIGDKWLGTATSIFFTAFDLGLGTAPFLFGFIAGKAGYSSAFLFTSLSLMVYSIYAYSSLKQNVRASPNI